MPRIARAWEPHPRRFVVESSSEFLDKAAVALQILRDEMSECCKHHVTPALRDHVVSMSGTDASTVDGQ